MHNPYAPIVALGGQKCGKTYGIRARVARLLPRRCWYAFVALDLNCEWPGEPLPPDTPHAIATTARGLARAMAHASEHPLIIYRPPIDLEATAPVAEAAVIAAKLCIDCPHPCVLILPEAHLSCAEGRPLPPALQALAHRGRHPDVRTALWADTHHPRDLHKEVLNGAGDGLLELYAQGGASSERRLRAIGGRELVEAINRAGDLVLKGEPGWHVRISGLSVRPPYQLVRA